MSEDIRQIEKEFNANGCFHGNLDRQRLSSEVERLGSYYGSVKAGQELFINDIFPKMKESVEESKEIARNSKKDIVMSANMIEEARECVKESKKSVNTMVCAFLGGLLLLVATNVYYGSAKLSQDSDNQNRLEEHLIKMDKRLCDLEKK